MVVLSGFAVAFPLFLLWALSKGRFMGFGDVKLAVGMGMMLGLLGGFSALIFGIWLGAIVSVLAVLVGKISTHLSLARGGQRLTMKSEIPFGPFLVAATLFVFFTHTTILSLIEVL